MIITLSIILIIVGAIYRFYPKIKGVFIKKNPVVQPVPNPPRRIFNAKSKCFDCEKQINRYNTTAYNLVHPTKCFDCEKQIERMYNNKNSNLGHSTKCFTCESN